MPRVISIGQCGFDHANLAATLRRAFGAEVVPAADLAQARRVLDPPPALVLVNRKLDADGGDGLELIAALKNDPATASLPVMLVSNYPQYQDEALSVGAVRGFGKAELAKPATIERLRPYLT